MECRALGTTGLTVSAVGFGGLGIGGGYGRNDRSEALKAVACALDHGVTFFDTAPMYGDSEEILGEALANVRDRVVIATKAEGSGDDFIRESVEASLRRLRTDYIDIIQLRDPNFEKLERLRVVQTFDALKAEGKVRFGSVTVGDTHQVKEALLSMDRGFATIQLAYHMVFRAAEGAVLDRVAGDGVGIVARGPLCKGFLTGRFTEKPADMRADRNFSWWTPDEADTLLAIQADLSTLALPGRRTLAQSAIRFVLRQPSISTTIPSLETVAEVEEIVGSLAAPGLTDDEMQLITRTVNGRPEVDY